MAGTPDYYAALGVGPDATQQQIARAYRALMRSHHPDVGGEAAPEGALLGIMRAFTVLRDPVQRAAYDAQRAAPVSPAIPVRKVNRRSPSTGYTIMITPVRWESGPWS